MIDPELSLGDLLIQNPRLGQNFEALGLDFCCGGQRSLRQAAAEAGLDLGQVVRTLQAVPAEAPVLTRQTAPVRPEQLDRADLVALIVDRHHAYLRRELPRLLEWSGKVVTAHQAQDSRLVQLKRELEHLADELYTHLDLEEDQVFPALLAGEVPPEAWPGLRVQAEAEHVAAGESLDHLRRLTDQYARPAWSCATHSRLMAGLEHLEKDLHQHIHLENNLLFRFADRA